eukprot:5895318-Prymnesium_polylepis.1
MGRAERVSGGRRMCSADCGLPPPKPSEASYIYPTPTLHTQACQRTPACAHTSAGPMAFVAMSCR